MQNIKRAKAFLVYTIVMAVLFLGLTIWALFAERYMLLGIFAVAFLLRCWLIRIARRDYDRTVRRAIENKRNNGPH